MRSRIARTLVAVPALVMFLADTCLPQGVGANSSPRGPGNPSNSFRTPVIVELFTSEGCSSCPPADALLSRLDTTQPVEGAEVIVLSEHVDYWNHLGWADPYSSAGFSARQNEYASALGSSVFTPQMVVDGRTEFVGSNAGRALDAISGAAHTLNVSTHLALATKTEDSKDRTVPLQLRLEGLPPVRAGDTLQIMLAITESNLRSSVSRGENAGRSLRHTGVVRQLTVLGQVPSRNDGTFSAEPVVKLARGWKRENLRVVVFVQERASHRILGGAQLSLGSEASASVR